MDFALIGTGNIAKAYVKAFANLPDHALAACVSRSGRRPEGLEDVESKPSLDALETPFEAVVATTPNGLHAEAAAAAAKLGKHVLVEKPLEISRPAMDAMIRACREAGVVLAVSYQRRCQPDNQAVKRLLDEGRLGRIYAADLSARFHRDQAYYDSAPYRGGYAIDGGGPFIQQASHNLDLYCWLFGLPERVSAERGRFARQIEAEDHGAALLRHDSGQIGTIVASTVAKPGFPPRLEVVCEKGTFTLLDDRLVQWEVEGVENPAAQGGADLSGAAKSAAVADTAAHEAVIENFVQSCRGEAAPIADAESARLATELILRIYEASPL